MPIYEVLTTEGTLDARSARSWPARCVRSGAFSELPAGPSYGAGSIDTRV
jgi:hypothetical protein